MNSRIVQRNGEKTVNTKEIREVIFEIAFGRIESSRIARRGDDKCVKFRVIRFWRRRDNRVSRILF